MWVVMHCTKQVFGGFRHRVEWRISEKMSHQWMKEAWDNYTLGDTMRAMVLEVIE